MSISAIAAALLSLCHLSSSTAYQLASAIEPAARQHGIDPLLLVAVVTHESRGRNVVAKGRGRGRMGCDVGVAQIHVPGCAPQLVQRYLSYGPALMRSARILALGRRQCATGLKTWYCGKRRGWVARYNPRSRRWWRAVISIWMELRSRSRGIA